MASVVEIENVGSVCLDDVNFTVYATLSVNEETTQRERMSQQQAIDECAALDNFSLGPILDETELKSVITFIEESKILFPFNRTAVNHRISFYNGLEAKDGQELNGGNTSVFTFVEDEFNANEAALEFYHGEAAEFPWKTLEPNNFDGQNCGILSFLKTNNSTLFANGEVDDVDCDDGGRGFICRGSCFIDPKEEEANELSIYFFGTAGLLFLVVVALIGLYLNEAKKLRKLNKSFFEPIDFE